jgi:hypothetical protein
MASESKDPLRDRGDFSFFVRFSSSMPLCNDPDADDGLATHEWVEVVAAGEDDDERSLGVVECLVFRYGLATNLGEDLVDAADAESGDALALAEFFFEDSWLRDSFGGVIGGSVVAAIDWPDSLPPDIMRAVLQRIEDYLDPAIVALVEDVPSKVDLRLKDFGFESADDRDRSWRLWYRTTESAAKRMGMKDG